MSGSLYLVATPVGNLGDISTRALEVLTTVDKIAAEDTRHSRKLLSNYQISTSLISYHDHNERERAKQLVDDLLAGSNIALVSDAGTPGIADPGYHLVRSCHEAGVQVISIPGPSAVISALAASGLPTDQFYFGGFLPVKKGKRRRAFEELQNLPATLIFYESPHRLLSTLEIICEVFPLRLAAVARELTKIHEEVIRLPISELKDHFTQKGCRGECVLLIAGAGKTKG